MISITFFAFVCLHCASSAMYPPSNFSVSFPAASAPTANVTYEVIAAYNTTGRVAVVKHPAEYFHVYCAGCDTYGNCTGKLEVVSAQAARHRCRYATNGGPFAVGSCLSPIISNGTVMSRIPQGTFQCVGMFFNGSWMLGYVDPALYSQIRNLMCGFNWLVVDGEPLTFSDIEIAPRTAFGFDDDGALITLVAEGSEVVFKGITMNQTASWMKALGSKWAINMDGGGSSTSYWPENGGVQGCPTCIDEPFCCERSVSTIMCVPYDLQGTP